MVGFVTGIAAGWLMTRAFRRFWVPDHLHGVVVLSLVLMLFAISDRMAHESGLITVTVFGIWLANQKHSEVEHIIELKENLRTLLIGCLFVVLGSRIEVWTWSRSGFRGSLFLALLIFVIRPLSVFHLARRDLPHLPRAGLHRGVGSAGDRRGCGQQRVRAGTGTAGGGGRDGRCRPVGDGHVSGDRRYGGDLWDRCLTAGHGCWGWRIRPPRRADRGSRPLGP
jgi:hypothetical protein